MRTELVAERIKGGRWAKGVQPTLPTLANKDGSRGWYVLWAKPRRQYKHKNPLDTATLSEGLCCCREGQEGREGGGPRVGLEGKEGRVKGRREEREREERRVSRSRCGEKL